MKNEFKFECDEINVTIDVDNMIHISDDMSVDLHKLPMDYFKVTQYIAKLRKEKETTVAEYNRIWGVRYRELKGGGYEQQYGAKPTENGIELALYSDPLIIANKDKQIKLQSVIDTLFGIKDSLSYKMDSMREIGSHIRVDKRNS